MARKPQLAIGTAAFGMNYGVDTHGILRKRVKHNEIGKIISMGALAGIKIIDTAAMYGASVKALGRYANRIDNQQMKIVYKIPTYNKINQTVLNTLKAVIDEDVRTMKTGIYCIMVHNPKDLMRENSNHLFNFLMELKLHNICEKIGVSVYDPTEMISILDRFCIDLVQLPTNIFDQRFDRDFLRKIKKRSGIEIHARSLFLQGKIFQDPGSLGRNFKLLKRRLETLRDLGLSPLQASLDYISKISEIDHVIMGVHNSSQLTDIILNYRKTKGKFDWTPFMIPNPREINPRLW